MAISIPSDLLPHVDRLVNAGLYPSADAVVRDALTQLLERHDSIAQLEASITASLAEFDRGEGAPFDSAEIKKKGRELLARKAP